MFDLPVAYTITELNTLVRVILEGDERMMDVWVEGEVSNLRQAGIGGHVYFTLKDSGASLRCVLWRSSAERLGFTPQDGEHVRAHGKIGVYEVKGEYQLYVDKMRPLGLGDLYQRFEQLKAALAAEGVFDAERKRPLPAFPLRIGVVTSPEAAAFQDVLNVLRRRFPIATIILSPTPVQGDLAPPAIVRALARLNDHDAADVILICRGGGSIEDLWAFNDERVARAVAESRLPVISGVGHEIDFTLCDFAADERAPTPSAAAEILTPDLSEISQRLEQVDGLLDSYIESALENRRDDLENSALALRRASPDAGLRRLRQQMDDWGDQLIAYHKAHVALWRERLNTRTAALTAADPFAPLERGYALVTLSDSGATITGVRQAPPGTGVTIRVKDGELKARIEDKDSHAQYSRTLF
jgi:exodeoxyribonuclease VII large subunit